MPGYSIPIKARMLYSSCKAPLLASLEDIFGIKIDKKVELEALSIHLQKLFQCNFTLGHVDPQREESHLKLYATFRMIELLVSGLNVYDLHYTRILTPKRVETEGNHLCGLAPEQHSFWRQCLT